LKKTGKVFGKLFNPDFLMGLNLFVKEIVADTKKIHQMSIPPFF